MEIFLQVECYFRFKKFTVHINIYVQHVVRLIWSSLFTSIWICSIQKLNMATFNA
jgi:hypothetical protein